MDQFLISSRDPYCASWYRRTNTTYPPPLQMITWGQASFATMSAGCASKGWDNVPLFSASGSTFGEDLGVSFTAEQQAAKDMPYNFGRQWKWGTQGPGVSVFKKDKGAIYHTYSTYSAGLGGQVSTHFKRSIIPQTRTTLHFMFLPLLVRSCAISVDSDTLPGFFSTTDLSPLSVSVLVVMWVSRWCFLSWT